MEKSQTNGFDIQIKMAERLSAGLRRKTLTTPCKWSEAYVILGGEVPGPYRVANFPWQREMLESTARYNIGMKGAQVGYSVVVLLWTLFNLDVNKKSCLYLLPTKQPDATDFSSTRFDPLLEMSSHLAMMFSDVKNVHTKRAGPSTLYIRGANSRSGLKSIPVGRIVFDEFDEMPEQNIPLARERMSGHVDKAEWLVSTPTVPEFGIAAEFNDSTQEYFVFPCPACSKRIHLTEDNLKVCGDSILDPDVAKSYLFCHECGSRLPEHKPEQDEEINPEIKLSWLRTGAFEPFGIKNYDRRGFHTPQFYSPKITAPELAKSKLLAAVSLPAEQEWYNSKCGLPHLTEGARISDEQIDDAIKAYRKGTRTNGKWIAMGVDVGTYLNCEITEFYPKELGNDLNVMSDAKVLWEGKVEKFELLDQLMKDWQILFCVIDSQPEKRKSYEFACRFWGHVKLCYYANNLAGGNRINIPADREAHTVSVDRTLWMDMALGRFHNKTIELPVDLSAEYRQQLKAPMRVFKENRYGHPIAEYITPNKNSKNDHFAHSRTYSEIALPLMASFATNRNITVYL